MVDLIELQAEITEKRIERGKRLSSKESALVRAKKRYKSSLLGWKELKRGYIFYVTDTPKDGKCIACHWLDYGDGEGIQFRCGAAVAIPESYKAE